MEEEDEEKEDLHQRWGVPEDCFCNRSVQLNKVNDLEKTLVEKNLLRCTCFLKCLFVCLFSDPHLE